MRAAVGYKLSAFSHFGSSQKVSEPAPWLTAECQKPTLNPTRNSHCGKGAAKVRRISLTNSGKTCYTISVSRRGWTHFLRSESMSRCILSSLTFVAFSFSCFAQDSSTGAIRGAVLDPSNRSIAGASVAIVNEATGIHYERISDLTGHFVFELLPPGDYFARVSADGMSPQMSPGIHVAIGGTTEISFRLALGGARESVTVSAEPRSVETQP